MFMAKFYRNSLLRDYESIREKMEKNLKAKRKEHDQKQVLAQQKKA